MSVLSSLYTQNSQALGRLAMQQMQNKAVFLILRLHTVRVFLRNLVMQRMQIMKRQCVFGISLPIVRLQELAIGDNEVTTQSAYLLLLPGMLKQYTPVQEWEFRKDTMLLATLY